MDPLMDNLIEDEAEREILLTKPTCFIVVGRPVISLFLYLLDILYEGKSIPEDMVLKLILTRLNSPDVEHYGYVLCCLPFMSEECVKIHEQIDLIKNLKLTPDFIINIKCADKDLVQRLSGLKQHPETGQLYSMDQLKGEELDSKKTEHTEEVEDENEDGDEEEEVEEQVCSRENTSYFSESVNVTVNNFFQDYMTNHNPLYLLELDGNKTPEELYFNHLFLTNLLLRYLIMSPFLFQEDLLRIMSSCSTRVPGFRWRRSRWGRTCPVALKEGKVVPGKPGLSVGFQDKLYILSSQEAYQKFVTNPRRYLVPPMPRPPCRVSIIGPPQAGKTTLCRLLAQHYGALVLDMEELVQPVLAKVEQERLEKIREETTQVAIEKIKMKMEQDGVQNSGKLSFRADYYIHLDNHALEEAKQLSTSPLSLYTEVLESRIKEVLYVKDKKHPSIHFLYPLIP
uniref:Uncharacterized protein n=1 Tax=Mastacembelus armatus TaxID=205130 RepID=A0A7N8XC24_9TELE